MRRLVGCMCCLVAGGLCASAVGAQALWVGRWFSVPAASRLSARSFTLATLPDGRLRYEKADGRSYPVAGPFQGPGRTFVLKALSPRHLRWFFHDHGRFV